MPCWPTSRRTAARITHVMLGTTHATNAHARAAPPAARGGAAARRAGDRARCRRCSAWPADLRDAVLGGRGDRRRRPRVRRARDRAVRRGCGCAASSTGVRDTAEAVAVTGVFSPVSCRARAAPRAISPTRCSATTIAVSLSHEIGSLGLIERENATVLNAALAGVAKEVAAALEQSLADHGLAPTVFFAQNDGTLMALDYAVALPGADDRLGPGELAARRRVPDGLHGRARRRRRRHVDRRRACWSAASRASRRRRSRSAASARTSGCRTSLAIALGGGTIVRGRRRRCRRRPRQRRLRAVDESAGVRRRHADADRRRGRGGARRCGRRQRFRHRVASLLRHGLEAADALLADAIDRVKVGRGDRPLVLVGGGSVPGAGRAAGRVRGAAARLTTTWRTRSARRSRWRAVAGRRWSRIDRNRAGMIEAAAEKARDRAVQAGADPTDGRDRRTRRGAAGLSRPSRPCV